MVAIKPRKQRGSIPVQRNPTARREGYAILSVEQKQKRHGQFAKFRKGRCTGCRQCRVQVAPGGGVASRLQTWLSRNY